MKWAARKFYCNTVIILQLGNAGWLELYHNTLHCIVTSRGWQLGIVLQYTWVYCEVQWQETGLPVSQDRQLCRDTALGRGAGGVARRAGGAAGSRAQADMVCAAGRHGARGRRTLGRRAGGCAAAGARGAAASAQGARPGVLLGQRAMHSLHSACFWPDLTRYFS